MRIAQTTLPCILVLILGGTGMVAGDKAAMEKELRKFQGVWRFERVEAEGKEAPIEGFKGMTVTFEGDRFTVKHEDKVVQVATQTLDPSKSPKTLDVKVTDGLNKGAVMLGIYEINGDTLKVCFDPQGKRRPTEFKGAGSAQTLVVHRRVTK